MFMFPDVALWPFFVAGALILAHWNKRAALAFALMWLLTQPPKYIGLSAEYLMISDTLIIVSVSIASALFIDRIAAIFIALAGCLYCFYAGNILGVVPTKIGAEVIIFFGYLACGRIGPDKGLVALNWPNPAVPGVQGDTVRRSMGLGKAKKTVR